METNLWMQELAAKLNKAAKAYYNGGQEIMSNKEYDALYDELVKLEAQTGIVLSDSPTHKVGFTVMDKLPKVKHEYPALSLDKTKDINVLAPIFNVRDGSSVVMPKCDGATICLVYDSGKLVTASTRGDGEVGSDITHNAPFIKGIPMQIPYKGHLVVRGEALMTYSEFERVNAVLPEEDKYKNPRNLASSTISMLDSREMSKRGILFKAFSLVYIDKVPSPDTFYFRLFFLNQQGFNVVETKVALDEEELREKIAEFTEEVKSYDYPVDGLVVALNDTEYSLKQPGTSHHPNPLIGYAFKWADNTAATTLREIEWSPSRTGLLNPVAIFDPVELEGTTVSRATLHNVSYIKDFELEIGDKITVFKANLIIPSLDENLSKGDHSPIDIKELVKVCPVCGEPVVLDKSASGTIVAKCENPDCAAKHVGKYAHFCERDCMNIEGLSEATIERLVDKGFIKEYADLYHLDRFKSEIVKMEGFGQKSYEKMIAAIEKSRDANFVGFIHALGVPNVGKGQAKILRKIYGEDIMAFLRDCCNGTDFSEIDGFGEVIANSIHRYFFIPMQSGPKNSDCEITRLLKELRFSAVEEPISENTLEGKTFVITGSVNHFANREELKDFIEARGGKTSGSVSKNTDYLINNDVTSTSGKNLKSISLGVPIISEDDFLAMV